MSRRHTLALLAACTAATIAIFLLYNNAAQADTCHGFRWGGHGRCWTKQDGAAFAQWLNEHGSNPARFRTAYPELAATFGKQWGLRQAYWKTCDTGYRCAKAVLPHYFENWRYALHIVDCETGGTYNARTISRTSDYGWFQINWPSWGGLPWVGTQAQLLTPRHNTRVAHRISGGGRNWSPWVCQ